MKLSSFQQTKWTRLFPPVSWLANYRLACLPSDAIAGITLAAYAIPVSLAYAGLAGLPPQVGIYGYLLGGSVTPSLVLHVSLRSDPLPPFPL
jgi:MFS superfamily sulfate permease-like transporter